MKHFKVFGRKLYILKAYKKGKFDAKSDECIFLGYSTRSKAYKCLNTNTKKIVKSENLNFDEHIEVQDDESITSKEEVSNPIVNQRQVLVSVESQPVNAEL